MVFRVKLVAQGFEEGKLEVLRFAARFQDEHGRVSRQVDPVRDAVLGAEVEYGPLFAYLFRRFGWANAACPVQSLVRYVLATPCSDMHLVVEPAIAGRAAEVFAFVAPAA